MNETRTEKSNTKLSPSQAFLKSLALALPDSKTQIIFWPLMAGGLALDLWTKKAVFDWLEYQGSVSIISGFLQFVRALNNGAAFGMFAGKPYFLTVVSIIALIVIFGVFLFSGRQPKLFNIALGILAAGVSGNLYDRIFNGGLVRDFIDVYYSSYHWPAFNVADALLCIGVGLVIISTFITQKSTQKHARQRK